MAGGLIPVKLTSLAIGARTNSDVSVAEHA